MNSRSLSTRRFRRIRWDRPEIAIRQIAIAGLIAIATAAIVADSRAANAADEKKVAPKANPKAPAAPKAAAAKPSDAADDATRFQPYGYVRHEEVVTISGQAVDEQSQPVAGARVFVIPVIPRGVPYDNEMLRPIATGKTDAKGRYSFEKVKLPVLEFAPAAVPRPTEGLFQVYAQCDNFGLVWRKVCQYQAARRPQAAKDTSKKQVGNAKADTAPLPAEGGAGLTFFQGEPIAVDLTFSPEVRFHGQITDDQGNPLKGVVVQVGLVNSSRDPPGTPPRSWLCGYVTDGPRGADGDFQGVTQLAEELRSTQTDADGFYEIRGLPRDCAMSCFIDWRPECDPFVKGIITAAKPAEEQFTQAVGYGGLLNHSFAAPWIVRVKVLNSAQKAVVGAIVRQESHRLIRRAGSMTRTGPDGTGTLQLSPGKCMLIVEPDFGQAYLPVRQEIEIAQEPREQSVDVQLAPAAEVIFEAVEKATGRPVAGVGFLTEPADARERQTVQTHSSFVDQPRTDATGKLHAFFEPGTRRFLVAARRLAPDIEAVSPTGDFVDLTPERPTPVRFEFARKTASDSGGQPDGEQKLLTDDVKPLADLLLQQAERYQSSRRMKFVIRRNNHMTAAVTRERLNAVFESFESKSVDDCLEALEQVFPNLKPLGATSLVTDGVRRRVESLNPNFAHLDVYNGEETIWYSQVNGQLDIYDRDNLSIHFVDQRDFWNGPAPRALLIARQGPGGEKPKTMVRHAAGRWHIDVTAAPSHREHVIDDATGFEYRSVLDYNNGRNVREVRQFFPQLLSGDVAYPKLTIKVDYQPNDQARAEITVIDELHVLDVIPPETFVIAAPAGTNVLDYRGIPRNQMGARRAAMGVISAPVPDVVAYRNRLPPAAEPVLKVGDPLPDFQVATWLNGAGPIARPDLADKILLIDFWGTTCGPCVAQLAEVNEAASHFADSKIAIIGLHDSSGQPDALIEFVKKRGLEFPIAIDKPSAGGTGFGATFRAFGIDAMPTSVVIDRGGKVAYLGDFTRAIEVADQLAKGKSPNR